MPKGTGANGGQPIALLFVPGSRICWDGHTFVHCAFEGSPVVQPGLQSHLSRISQYFHSLWRAHTLERTVSTACCQSSTLVAVMSVMSPQLSSAELCCLHQGQMRLSQCDAVSYAHCVRHSATGRLCHIRAALTICCIENCLPPLWLAGHLDANPAIMVIRPNTTQTLLDCHSGDVVSCTPPC